MVFRKVLSHHEKKVYSQFGEDGIIEEIFKMIGVTNKKYLEFGATATINNTENLHKNLGFTGTLWGNSKDNCDYNKIYEEFVTVENIKELLEKYSIDKELDFLSIDIDSFDFYIWNAIVENGWKPRVVVIEYNGFFGPDDDYVIQYEHYELCKTNVTYFGASLKSMYLLGRKLGYSLVCCNTHGNNAFFIRDDCVGNVPFLFMNDVKMLYRPLAFECFTIDKDLPWTSYNEICGYI